MEGYLAEVRLFAGIFAPTNWAFCDGSVLQVRENTALFVLIGNFYGGDGRKTFALPDLRGRVVVGTGQGNGLSSYEIAQAAGADQVPTQPVQATTGGGPPTFTATFTPTHTPTITPTPTNTPTNTPTVTPTTTPTLTFTATTTPTSTRTPTLVPTATPSVTVSSVVAASGNNVQPVLGLNYIICVRGTFPRRAGGEDCATGG